MIRISDYFNDVCDYYYIDYDCNIYSALKDKYLKFYISSTYKSIDLKLKNGDKRKFRLHSLMNYIFNGPPDENIIEPVTDHIDGDRMNNNPKNLRWIEKRLNSSYEFIHKNKSTITDKDVVDIFNMYNNGKSTSEISKTYNTTGKYIRSILTGENRKCAISRYGLKPIQIKTRTPYDIIFEICFLLLGNQTVKEISNIMRTPISSIVNIKTKIRHKEIVKDFDFENKTTNIFDNSEKFSINLNEPITIGETEYVLADSDNSKWK